eukprot:TRINITY_DN7621_c0_g1_i1.p1 TRINITY_DN7621_c0_g1~~TRINITY_DN7621_c0_g1_i1.p1  ORF type:complete len:775 (-),score=96.67 TRINITY_DN7621_c0_g1_i1:167-2467(-)
MQESSYNELFGSRPTSAPPILEQFDMMTRAKTAAQFATGLSDIRTAPGYNDFYFSNVHLYPHLPPPLETYHSQVPQIYHQTYSQFSPGLSLPYSGRVPSPVPSYPIGHQYGVPGMYDASPEPMTRNRSRSYDHSTTTSEISRSSTSSPLPIPTPQSTKSSPIVWMDDINEETIEANQRHYNNKFGKVTLRKDSELSSSTDDLLKLAGAGHLLKLSEEEEGLSKRNIKVVNRDQGPLVPNPISSTNSKAVQFGYAQQQSHVNKQRMQGNLIADMQNLNLNHDVDAPYPYTPVTSPSPPPSSTANTSSKYNNICRYYMNGYCSRGERCNYSHGDADSEARRLKFSRIPASRYANLTIEECKGEIYSMCLDQHGCRFLQKELDKSDPEITQLIFSEVILHIVELTRDPFGNYLCQKLVEHSNEEQRLAIVKSVTGDIVRISKNMHGTRAAQKIIECLDTSEEIKVIRDALKGSVVELIQDLNGNHVIQKCLHRLEPNDNQFIYDVVALHCIQVATHRHGCCVFQRCIDHGTASQKKQLVEQIKVNSVSLVQDAFGNYVVQYALDLDFPNLATDLIAQFQGRMYQLAKQKFSSNVVEKCLKMGSLGCVKRSMRELLFEDVDTSILNPVPQQPKEVISKMLLDLLQDSYGNYVVQTCLFEGSTKAVREYRRMVDLLVPYLHQLRSTPYSKKIQHLLSLPTPNEDEVEEVAVNNRSHSRPTSPRIHKEVNGNGHNQTAATLDKLYYGETSPRFLQQIQDVDVNRNSKEFRHF